MQNIEQTETAPVSQNDETEILRTALASAKTDAQEYKKLAACNREEADALRKAAGVACDDTISEGINKVYQLRGLVSEAAHMLPHLTGENLETYARTFAALAKAAL